MKNVHGADGVINVDGMLGSKAKILDIHDPFFYDSIEEGIRSTVKIIIKNGFETYSSCQGHHNSNYSLRNVVIALDKSEIDAWRAMIADLNVLKNFKEPITYLIIDYKNDKKGFMVIFGSVFNIVDTEFKQKCFEEYLPKLRKSYYCHTSQNIVDYTARCGHINVFSD